MNNLAFWQTLCLELTGWFLSTLRIFLGYRTLDYEGQAPKKANGCGFGRDSRLTYVLGSLWDVRAIPTYRVYRTCDNIVDAHTGPMG